MLLERDLKSLGLMPVRVRFPPSAPISLKVLSVSAGCASFLAPYTPIGRLQRVPIARRVTRSSAWAVGRAIKAAGDAIMSKIKMFGLALALAAGAFWLTMLKDPPRSVASDPTAPPAKTADIRVPTGIPSGDSCVPFQVCP